MIFWHAMAWPYPFETDKIQATAMIDHAGFAAAFPVCSCGAGSRPCRGEIRPPLGPWPGGVRVGIRQRAAPACSSSGRKETNKRCLRHMSGETAVTYVSGARIVRSSQAGGSQVRLCKTPVIYELPSPINAIEPQGKK